MGNTVEIKLEGLTLANVSEGGLEERFQELLGELAEIHENALDYVGNSSGERVSTIQLEVTVRYRPAMKGDPSQTLIVSGAELKRPKRMKSAQAAYSRDGALLVEKDPFRQVEAFGEDDGRGGVIRRMVAKEGTSDE